MRHSAGIWTRNSVIKFINRIEFEFAPKIEWNIIAKRQIKASAFTSINTQLNHSPARKWIDSGDGLMIPHLIRFRNAASLEGSTRTTRCATWAGVSAAPWCGWDSNAERCSEWSCPTCPSFPSSCSVPPGSACPSPPSTPSTLQVILFFFSPIFFQLFSNGRDRFLIFVCLLIRGNCPPDARVRSHCHRLYPSDGRYGQGSGSIVPYHPPDDRRRQRWRLHLHLGHVPGPRWLLQR